MKRKVINQPDFSTRLTPIFENYQRPGFIFERAYNPDQDLKNRDIFVEHLRIEKTLEEEGLLHEGNDTIDGRFL